jgi:hypothetical protein
MKALGLYCIVYATVHDGVKFLLLATLCLGFVVYTLQGVSTTVHGG